MDITRIEPYLVQENYLLMMGVHAKSVSAVTYIPLRVTSRDPLFYYVYDPIAEGAIPGPVPAAQTTNGTTNIGFTSPVMFGSQNISGNPPNVFRVYNQYEMYQLFWGVSPSYTRVYRQVPRNVSQGDLDVQTWSDIYNNFGYIDGFTSPFDSPSPLTEQLIPQGLDIAWAMANPIPFPIRPLFNFIINKISVSVVNDAQLIQKMLTRSVPTKYFTIGGISSGTYDASTYFGTPGLSLDSTPGEVSKFIAGLKAPNQVVVR